MPLLQLALLTVLTVFPFAPASAQDLDAIGTIMEIEGTVHKGGQPATIDMPVYMNDVITTGASSRALILFIDDTELALGDDTQLAIDEYVFTDESDLGNKGRYSIMRGVFDFTSGLMTKNNHPDVTINTVYGSIGLRGTKVWGGEIDGTYGILVSEGAVDVHSGGQPIRVGRGYGLNFNREPGKQPELSIWKKERIERAGKTVGLKNAQAVHKRMAIRKEEQKKTRSLRRDKILKQREMFKDQRDNRLEQHQEKRGEIREQLQERREQQNNTRDTMQNKREELREKVQQQRQQRLKNLNDRR